MEPSSNSTFRPALLLTLGKLLAFAPTFFIPVILVRAFDQAEFGTYKQIFLIFATLYGIAQVGMAESLFYFLPRDPARAGRYVLNSMLGLALSGFVCLVILKSQSARVGAWLSNPALAQYLGLLGLFLLLFLAATGLEIVMISRRSFLRASGCYAISDTGRAVLLVLPALLGWGLYGVMVGAVVFASLRLCAAVFYFVREFQSEWRTDGDALRQQLGYALPFAMAVVVEVLYTNLPHYAVAHHFDARIFAIYSVGCLQLPLVDFVANSAGNVMMVRMGEEIREGRNGAMLAVWHDTISKLALIFFPLVSLLILCAPQIIALLFTKNYAASVPVFRLWSLIILLSVLQSDAVLRVYADTRFLFGLNTLRLILIVLFVKSSLSLFGLRGAVIVALGAAVTAKALALGRIKHLVGAGLSRFLPWRNLFTILGCAALAGVPALAVEWRVTLPVLSLIFLMGFVYSSAYLALLLWSGQLRLSSVWALVSQTLGSRARAIGARRLEETLEVEQKCAALPES